MVMRTLTAALFALTLAIPFAASLEAQTLSGRRAPSFNLPDSSFKRYDILDYRGKWLIVNFISTQANQCADCPTVSQRLDAFRRAHQGNVEVLTVAVAPPEDLQKVADYIGKTKISNPVVFDQGQMTASFFNATPQNNRFDTPHVFAINPQGQIVRDWGQVGAASVNMIPALEQLVGGNGKGK